MKRSYNRWAAWGVVLALLPGCPDKEIREAPKDLGTDGAPLMPRAGTMLDTTLVGGSADWVPFRELDESSDQSDAPEPAVETDNGTGLTQEIRDLLKDYNDLLAKRDIDEMLVYHIEAHQDAVASMYESQFAILDKLDEVETALVSALPDEKDRISDVFVQFRTATGKFTVNDLTVENDSLVTGTLENGLAPTCRFVLTDDEWYIDIPNLPEALEQMKPAIDAMTSGLSTIPQAVQEGQVPAQSLLATLEVQVKMMLGGGEDTGDSEDDGASGDEPDSN